MRSGEETRRGEEIQAFILFSDLKDFSKLETSDIQEFFQSVLPVAAEKTSRYLERALFSNTWGDALLAVFREAGDAIQMMLAYRDAFRELEQESGGKFRPRIAGHYGRMYVTEDPVLGRKNVFGRDINTAARIEPVTRPGEVFVTREFMDALPQDDPVVQQVEFGELGIVALAKGFGERHLFHLTWKQEVKLTIDTLMKLDLSTVIPPLPAPAPHEQVMLAECARLTDPEAIRDWLSGVQHLVVSGPFSMRVANLCKKAGLYEAGLNWAIRAEGWAMPLQGITLHPFRFSKGLLKIKADCLTRLGAYDEAADLLYGLWQNGYSDSDSISMLAAQFKRRALLRDGQIVRREEINRDLLTQAKNLYLEAFRINMGDDDSIIYPAINAAYLQRMLGGKEEQSGRMLAAYISSIWGTKRGHDWWVDCALAEAELLQDHYEQAKQLMAEALRTHQDSMDAFARQATLQQVEQYLKVMDKTEEGACVLEVLCQIELA